MRTRVIPVVVLSLSLLVASCGDDSTDVDASGEPSATVPARSPDLVGTITSVTPFEPVTEDCTPAEDLDPDGAVSSDDPPVCTPEDNDIVGTVLVEETPDAQEGRKISFTLTTETVLAGGTADAPVTTFDDLAVGQRVESWVRDGVCAESYPEQCGAEALRVTD